jgi:hypothetical protein
LGVVSLLGDILQLAANSLVVIRRSRIAAYYPKTSKEKKIVVSLLSAGAKAR